MVDYTMVVTPLSEEEGGGFMAYYPDLPGCLSDGETPEEAVENAKDAFLAWMSVQEDRGAEVPKPGAAIEEAKQREKDIFNAAKTFVEYADHAEERIAELERMLEHVLSRLEVTWSKSSPQMVICGAHAAKKALAKH